MTGSRATPLLRDTRFWRVAGQVISVIAVAALIWFFRSNLTRTLAQLGIQFGYRFLGLEAGFAIGQTPIPYTPEDPYSRAMLVGLVNTARVAAFGVIFATALGIAFGLMRLSSNWLAQRTALGYVEIMRNTPLLLQLLFWYTGVIGALPRVQDRIEWPGPIYLSNRGLALPGPAATAGSGTWAVAAAIGLIAAWLLWRWRTRRMLEHGGTDRPALWALGALAAAAGAAWLVTRAAPFAWEVPRVVRNLRFEGGTLLTPEYAALLAGLSFYTGAFIAEIVRAGILSVSRGQWEAARALGLRPGAVLRLVVFPQAMRVIIPPLTSQYLNLTKNSSLALAIGFQDVYSVSSTSANQTGRVLEIVVLLAAVYLSLSLLTSLIMNLYNRAIQLVER